MLRELFRGINRIGREFGVFQVEISTYSSLESQIHPRAAFAEQWTFQKMSLDTFQKISRHFPLARWVSICGWGEPLENESIIPMLHLAKQSHCLTGLTTNGVNLTENLALQLLQEGLDLIVISLEIESQEIQEILQNESNFKHITEQVEGLVQIKKKLRRDKPFIKLSFPMTRLNMRELPNVVPLAARLGVEEVIFTHLDYLPDQRWNILRTFYHESPTPAFQESIDEIRRLGNKMGVGVKIYPLKAEEVLVCEANPPRNVVFSVDGSVAPCPYLRIPKKGDIPRIFMHKEYRVPQTSFGNINHEDFLEVWNKEPYKKFREIFEERNKAGTEGSSGLRPLSELCQTCYKAYGI